MTITNGQRMFGGRDLLAVKRLKDTEADLWNRQIVVKANIGCLH
jgi:hypothetical protein